jgi:hypothetical protein
VHTASMGVYVHMLQDNMLTHSVTSLCVHAQLSLAACLRAFMLHRGMQQQYMHYSACFVLMSTAATVLVVYMLIACTNRSSAERDSSTPNTRATSERSTTAALG